MALTTGQKLNHNDVTNAYINSVINVIKQGCYDVTSPPTCAGLQAVPSNILGNLSTELYNPEVGLSQEKDTGNNTSLIDIYNSLIKVTKYLLRVGTFSFTVYKTHNSFAQGNGLNGNLYYSSISGKAFFTQAYAEAAQSYTDGARHESDFKNAAKDEFHPKGSYPSHLVTVNNGGVLAASVFSVDSITKLITNCYNAWSSSGRPVYTATGVICHYNCYANCHSSCHSSCHGSCDSGFPDYWYGCYSNDNHGGHINVNTGL